MIFFLWIFGVVNFVSLDPGRNVFCEHFSLTKKEKTEKKKKKRGFSNELYCWTGIIDPSLAGSPGTKVDILCL